MKKLLILPAIVATVVAPAFAQEAVTPVDAGGTTVRIGIGGAYLPSYEGSDDYIFSPFGNASITSRGRSIFTRGTKVYLDLIPAASDNSFDLELGPVAGLNLNRTSRIKDVQVKRLGEKRTAIEVGGFVGFTKTGVITSAYDTLTLRVSYVQDVNRAHRSHVITPSIEYGTPLSPTTYVGLTVSADITGDGYARYYYDVTPAESAFSGLSPSLTNGGLKNIAFGLLAAKSLTGDLRKGLSIFAIGNYSRLQKDFRRSSIVSEAGSPNQWIGGLGLAYSF